MKELQCELCGSTDIIKQEGVFVCQSCNTKYSLEEAKKMMFSNETTQVNVNNTLELQNLYDLARSALNSEDFTVAWGYYKQILYKNPHSWEALFYTIYCRVKTIKMEEFIIFEGIIIKTLKKILTSVKNEVNDENKQKEIIEEISDKTLEMTDNFYNVSKHYYNLELDQNLRAEEEYISEYLDRCGNAELILHIFGDSLIDLFGNKYSDLAVQAWKQSIEYRMTRIPDTATTPIGKETVDKYASKIVSYDSSYVAPQYTEPEMKIDNTKKKKKGLFGRFR